VPIAGNHPNGVYTLERAYIVTRDVEAAAAQYAKVLGLAQPKTVKGTVIMSDMAVFQLGEHGLGVVQPYADGPAADALKRRGPGPFQALYRTASMGAAERWMQQHGMPPLARGVRNTGEVFAALTERDGQLRGLIENSNTVFRTTAQRDRALRETFLALPTFEKESKATVERLATFARRTDPLVKDLRPVARELSPTLREADALAPRLSGLLRNLGPLIDASKTGLPAFQRFIDDVRPLFGQLDPFLRSLNPILEGLGLYRREVVAFFANAVAATGASDQPGGAAKRIHYLRTTQPVNPEVLAVYPKRVGTNRTNPYQLPGAFADLATGLKSFETRHCANGTPTIDPAPSPYLSDDLRKLINAFVFGGGTAAAPPCVKQGNAPSLGATKELTEFPHIYQDAKP